MCLTMFSEKDIGNIRLTLCEVANQNVSVPGLHETKNTYWPVV